MYLKFLNKNGADNFCIFHLKDKSIFNKKGLYLYTLDDALVYVGRCKDNFANRFNMNYGKISPKNCFKDGQSTNTHINSLMNKYHDRIDIYILTLNDDSEIEQLEKTLIESYNPKWNRKR